MIRLYNVVSYTFLLHTGLGEEGAEAMVGISGFALLGQVSVGLNGEHVSGDARATRKVNKDIPGCRAQGSRAGVKVKSVQVKLRIAAPSQDRIGAATMLSIHHGGRIWSELGCMLELTSQQELAI
jgi:hypothetical protein